MLLKKNKIYYERGFTLGELLIVIAVITVLSSIVLFTFSGSQEKAVNSKRLGIVSQYITALEMYRQNNGHYPIEITKVCLGSEPNNRCGLNDGVNGSTSFNNEMSPYMSELSPIPNLKLTNPINPNNISWDGAVYSCVTSSCYKYQITWFVKYTKSQSCGQGKISTASKISDDTECVYTSMSFK